MPDLIDIVRSIDGAEEALRERGLSHRQGSAKWGSSTEDWWWKCGAHEGEANDAMAAIIIRGIAGEIIEESGGDTYLAGDGQSWEFGRVSDSTFGECNHETHLHDCLALIAARHKEQRNA
jgi:hypothetical protein